MRVLAALLLTLACSSSGGTTPAPDTDGGVAGLEDLNGGSCGVVVANPPDEGANHLAICAPTTYQSKPPSSGNHYPVWPLFRVYDKPVPWGFLVHGLEHGAVVIVYNCPSGCPDQVAAVKALVEATPSKPGCSRPPVIVAPDPTLDVPIAASAWRYTLRAQCFDHDRFAAFIARRANHGRESIDSDCGAADREMTGWCP
jgi:hypothetical protein